MTFSELMSQTGNETLRIMGFLGGVSNDGLSKCSLVREEQGGKEIKNK